MNNYKIAGFWIKFLAHVLDLLIPLIILFMLKMYIFYDLDSIYKKIIDISFCIAYATYYYVMVTTKWQATVGMQILGLKLVDKGGKRIPINKLFYLNRGEKLLIVYTQK